MAQWVGRVLTGCPQPHPPSSQLGWREVSIKSPAFLLEWQACDLSPRGQLAGESEYFQQRIQAESQGRPGSRSPTGRQPLGRFKGFLFSRTDSTHFPPPVCLDCPSSRLCLVSFYFCSRSNSNVILTPPAKATCCLFGFLPSSLFLFPLWGGVLS